MCIGDRPATSSSLASPGPATPACPPRPPCLHWRPSCSAPWPGVSSRPAAVPTGGRHLTAGSGAALVLLVAALAVAVAGRQPYAGGSRYALVVLLAIAMGLQNATARALDVPDATTTVLTLTLTGLAADSRLAAGANPRVLRRVPSVLAMLAGALVGGLLVLSANPAWALTAAALMLGAIVTISATLSRGTAPADPEDARVMPRSAQPSPPSV